MRRCTLFVLTLLFSTQICAAEFPTGVLKGTGFMVEKNNRKMTEKDLLSYHSSMKVVKQTNGRYEFTVIAHVQKAGSTPPKTNKTIDTYKIVWDSATSGQLININNAYQDNKSTFTLSKDQLVIKSWIAHEQMWETQYYSLERKAH